MTGYAVKTLESKETRAQRNFSGNAQFSLCCTSTKCRTSTPRWSPAFSFFTQRETSRRSPAPAGRSRTRIFFTEPRITRITQTFYRRQPSKRRSLTPFCCRTADHADNTDFLQEKQTSAQTKTLCYLRYLLFKIPMAAEKSRSSASA